MTRAKKCPICPTPFQQPAWEEDRDAALRYSARRRLELLDAIRKACEIIERGDARLLAVDGPCSDLPPALSLGEWRELYRILDRQRRLP